MSNPITSVTQAPPVQTAAKAPAAAGKPEAPAKQATPTDTVAISNSSEAILQGAQETHAQTLQEANGGDYRARRLLARETAATVTPKT
jgi:hypothetical protein